VLVAGILRRAPCRGRVDVRALAKGRTVARAGVPLARRAGACRLRVVQRLQPGRPAPARVTARLRGVVHAAARPSRAVPSRRA
jgi:hypothetical protein